MAMNAEDFNPAEKAIKIQGGALYLQVKDRLIWARKDHPNLCVRTEVVKLDEKIAVFHATASYIDEQSVHVYGEGHGSETPQGFPPGYIEKAETVAIGRALAALGYGTAAAFEEEESGKLADSPVQRTTTGTPTIRERVKQARPPSSQIAARPVAGREQQAEPPAASPTLAATEKQVRTIWTAAGEKGMDDETVHAYTRQHYQKEHVNELTRKEASEMIDYLFAMKSPAAKPMTQEPQKGYVGVTMSGVAPEEPAWMKEDKYIG